MRYLGSQQQCEVSPEPVTFAGSSNKEKANDFVDDNTMSVSLQMQFSVKYLKKQILRFYTTNFDSNPSFLLDLQLFLAKENKCVVDKVSHLSLFLRQYYAFFSSSYISTTMLLMMVLRDYLSLGDCKGEMVEMDVSLLQMTHYVWINTSGKRVLFPPTLFLTLLSNGLAMIRSVVTQLNSISLSRDRIHWQQCFNMNVQSIMINSPVCVTALSVDFYLKSQQYMQSLWITQCEAQPRLRALPFFRRLVPLSKEDKVKRGQVHLAQITPYINKVAYLAYCLPGDVKHVFLFDDQWRTGIQASYSSLDKVADFGISFEDCGDDHTLFEYDDRFFHLLAPSLLSSMECAQGFIHRCLADLDESWVLALDVDKTLMSAYTDAHGKACSMVGVGEGEVPFNIAVTIARQAHATVILTNGAAYRGSLKGYRRALQFYAYANPDVELNPSNPLIPMGWCQLM